MAAGGAGTDDWTMFRHDLQHSGYSTSTAPSTNQTQWIFTATSDVYSSPAVAGGRLYVGSYDGKVYCLNAATGASIWSYSTGGQVWSSPAVVEGKVSVGSRNGSLYCVIAAAA